MKLSHLNITMPRGAEEIARKFYTGILNLKEIPKPEALRGRGGIWFDAGGLDLHISVEENRSAPDTQRHFGLECDDSDDLKVRLKDSGFAIDEGRPAPWKRFFVHDPFGNRIELHEPGAMRS